MNPFDWFVSRHFTAEDLIAYHLQDLAPRRARRLQRALAVDTALAAESAAIRTTLDAFPRNEATPALGATDLDRYWLVMRSHMAVHVATPATTTPYRNARLSHPLLIAMGATAVTAVAVLLAALHHRHQQQETIADTAHRPALVNTQQAPDIAAKPLNVEAHQPYVPRPYVLRNSPFSPSSPILHAQLEPAPGSELWNPSPAQSVTPSVLAGPSPSALSLATPTVGIDTPFASHSVTHASGNTNQRSTGHRSHDPFSGDLTLGIFGNFIAGRSFNTPSTVTTGDDYHALDATPAVGVQASFHQQFSPLVGYRVTGAYSRPTLGYTYRPATAPGTLSGSSYITTRAIEISGTYVVQGPRGHRVHTSAEAGAGVLLFDPAQSGLSINSVARPAGIVGAGVELAVTQHWSLHAQYRALVFETPDFHETLQTVPIATTVVVSSQPGVGITYRFGKLRGD